MKTSIRVMILAAAAVALDFAATSAVHALPIISNGGFESGLASWTRADQVGSAGTFSSQSGTVSPVSGNMVPAPPQGTTAAMTDALGPGSHSLYQDFTATAGSAALSFALFIGNRASLEGGFTGFATPASLDFSTPTLNQQARVDILTTTADPFSVAAGDVLRNLYQTKVGDPLISGYNTITTDITALLAAHVGETLRLRFAETDNVSPFQLGVDNVRFDQVQIPEPASILLFGAALALLVGWRGRGLLSAHRCTAVVAVLGALISHPLSARADTSPLAVLDPNLQVTTVLNAGISQPIGIVFLGMNDFLVLEKASGQIKRVINGVIQPTPVLDLAVNSNSERGLLSVVLHPNFHDVPFAFVRWTESSTGSDSTVVSEVPLTGNQVDRFVWDGSALTFDRNLIMLRSRQTDNIAVTGHPGTANAAEQGNHNGGVLRFGPDGKLYLFMGDQGRRGWMQNLPNGPFLTAPLVDDTFGGPAPDNAHLSGVILRFNDDGSTPTDNPFFAVGAAIGGEVGANIQKVYSYGHRNGFGMAFDPYSGSLWDTENADDAYSEINRVIPGMNGGWVQLAGPLSRIADWKFIETTQFGSNLQQVRYPPTRAAYTAALALSRMFMLTGATYIDPDLSWRYEIGPAGATFVKGTALGAEYDGTLWMGSARSFQQVGNNGGSLYRFHMTTNRLHIDVSADPRLADRVFSPTKFEGTESATLQIGKGFGTTPSIEQGPDGNLYVVSLTDNAIYK